MLNYRIRYDEGSAKWQVELRSGWSKLMTLNALGQYLRQDITEKPVETTSKPGEPWNKPQAFCGPSQAPVTSTPEHDLWEIRGGKLQKIPPGRSGLPKEPPKAVRTQATELLELLGIGDE